MALPTEQTRPSKVVDLRIPRDSLLKLFVGQERFFRDLLAAYYPDIMEAIDIRALRSEPSSLVGLDVEKSEADAVWEIETECGHLFYMLVMCRSEDSEFVNPWELVCAVASLMVQLSEHPPTDWGYEPDRIPLVMGMFVYDGEQEWDIPLCTLDMFQETIPSLAKYLPEFRYRVADLRNGKVPELEGNLAALLHRLHVCGSPAELHGAARPLRDLLDPDRDNLLWRAFAACIAQSLAPAMGIKDTSASDSLEGALDRLERGA